MVWCCVVWGGVVLCVVWSEVVRCCVLLRLVCCWGCVVWGCVVWGGVVLCVAEVSVLLCVVWSDVVRCGVLLRLCGLRWCCVVWCWGCVVWHWCGLLQVKEGQEDARPKQRKRRSRESIRMPEDITEEELENVADRAKDKILDKENVSAEGCGVACVMRCVLMRLLMTSGQHMSPVPSEDPRHQDWVQGPVLRRGQRSVLRPLLTQPLRRRRPHRAAGSRKSLLTINNHFCLNKTEICEPGAQKQS